MDNIRATIEMAKPFDPWPEPDLSVIDGKRPAPKFPIECFGGWRDWILATAECQSAPPDYVGTALIAVASALIGNARWVSPWNGWKQPAVLWAALVGVPSSSKTPALDAVLSPVRRLQDEMSSGYQDELNAYETQKATAQELRDIWKSEVKEAVKKKTPAPNPPDGAREPDKPIQPRIIVTDATIEALARLLATTPRGLLFNRDELAGWLASFDRYSGGGDRPFWIEAYDGKPYIVDRRGLDEPLRIPSLALSAIGGIQPDRLNSLLMKGDDDGLASRFLVCWPDPIKPKRPTLVADDAFSMKAFRRLHELQMGMDENGNPTPVTIMFDSPAADLLDQWRIENNNEQIGASGLYLSHLGKHPGMVLRLALVMEFLEWAAAPGQPEPEVVSVRSFGFAAHLIDNYFRKMAERAYGDAALPEADRHMALLAKEIRKHRLEKINLRDVRREWHLPGLREAASVQRTAEHLVDAGWLRQSPSRKGDTPGQARKDYLVNPKIWEDVV